MTTRWAEAARVRRLLTARWPAAAVFRAELVLLALASWLLLALAVTRGGGWWAAVPFAGAAQALTATALARMAPGLRRHAVGSALSVLAAAFFSLVAVGPHVLPYRTLTVLSGSMTPTFRPGDLIVVSPETPNDLRVGQILSYEIPVGDHHVVSHRVVSILESGTRPVIITKGDANAAPDPWHARIQDPLLWRYRFDLPWLGYVIAYLRDPLLRGLCVLALPALLALYAIARVWQVKLPVRRKADATA